MKSLVQILMSSRNRKYRLALKHVRVGGERSLRAFHLRLPGEALVAMESLEFCEIDWTPTKLRLQPVFYRHLSYFTFVKTLYLKYCRFICAEDLAKVICALPNLDALNVDSITVERATHHCNLREKMANYFYHRDKSPRLTELCFWGQSDDSAYPAEASTGVAQALHQDVLDVLSSCSTSIVGLRVSTTQFVSFKQLQQFLDELPQLRTLALEREPQWKVPPCGTRLLAAETKGGNQLWEEFQLLEMRSASAQQFIDMFASRRHRVRTLEIELIEWPSPALHRAVARLTEMSGRMLDAFKLEIQGDRIAGFSEILDSQVSSSCVLLGRAILT